MINKISGLSPIETLSGLSNLTFSLKKKSSYPFRDSSKPSALMGAEVSGETLKISALIMLDKSINVPSIL